MPLFFDNFVPKKPENKCEGISPNYTNPHKGFALPGAKRFLSGSLGFLFSLLFFPESSLNLLSSRWRIDNEDDAPLRVTAETQP